MPLSIPPLNAVRAFEVAARYLNFSRAAEELGVTQGAISKQAILLEDYIGAKLFERLPGGLALTQEGIALRNSIAPAFELLNDAFGRFRRRPPRSNVCRISTLASFASQFLVLRLSSFEEQHPDIKLEILTSDRLVDLAREEVDVSVRYGPGGQGDLIEAPLVKGVLAAVSSPKLLERADDKKDLAAFLSSVRRIQVFSNNEWRKWSEVTGVNLFDAPRPFIIEDFVVAIEAVLAGQGVALLPEILVRKHLVNGDMASFCSTQIDWNQTYYTAHVVGAERRPVVREVLAWLGREVSENAKLSA